MFENSGTLLRMAALTSLLLISSMAPASAQTCPGWRDPAGKKVVGGTAATLAQWPSQAVLRLTAPSGKETMFVCGGTAIAADWVVTAAHCFDDIARRPDGRYASTDASSKDWTLDLVLGTDDLRGIAPANGYSVADVKIRDGYSQHTATGQGADIALVRLARRWVGPVATLSLDAATDPALPPGAALMVAGFGLTKGAAQGGNLKRHDRSDGSAFLAGSDKLLHVGLPLVATPSCAAAWAELQPAAPQQIGDGQICAGFEAAASQKDWKDSCGGDSGGPLVVHDVLGCPTHIGVVSWGAIDCGRPQAYGVYTRLSHHAAWLRRHVPGVLVKPNIGASAGATGADLPAGEFVEQVAALVGSARGTARISVRGSNLVKVDGRFAFEVTSEVAGRLVIIDVNAAGVATQIFPNEFVQRGEASLIRAGETVTVPGPGYGFDYFKAVPPLGKGRLIALVVPPDFPVHLLITAPVRAKGFVPERSATGYFMNLIQQIASHVTGRRAVGGVAGTAGGRAWAVAVREYEIVG